MHRVLTTDGTGLLSEWIESLRVAAPSAGLTLPITVLRGWLGGGMLIACIRRLGGTVTPLEPFNGWVLREEESDLPDLADFAPDMRQGNSQVGDFHGVVGIELDGERFLALRTDEPVHWRHAERVLVIGAASLESALRLAERLAAMRTRVKEGGPARVFGASGRLLNLRAVAEEDLLLPPDLKRNLLTFLDSFRHAAETCRRLGLAASRGALLLGPPGTGKTQTVRHMLARFPSFRFFILSAPASRHFLLMDSFTRMLEAVNDAIEPAVIVIEDIDYLLKGDLTPQFLLNTMDGLFQPRAPVLWLATSNDPASLEANLLDRPGRFDRIFKFTVPGADERAALIRRYAAFPLGEQAISELVASSRGLSAAHMREVCVAGALDSADQAARYEAAVRAALRIMVRQQDRARRSYTEPTERPAGFAVPVEDQ